MTIEPRQGKVEQAANMSSGATSEAFIPPPVAFYINMELKDKKALLKKEMQKEGLGFVSGVAAFFASAVVSDKEVSTGFGDEMLLEVATQLEEAGMGCRCSMELHGKFVCIKISIVDIDLDKLFIKHHKDSPQHWKNLIAAFHHFGLYEEAKQALNDVYIEVGKDVMQELATSIPADLEKEGITCDVNVVNEQDQDDWLAQRHVDVKR